MQPNNFENNNVLFVGQNRHHKGIDILLKAWEKIVEKYPKASLNIVGSGHPDYEQENVSTLGYVENKELYNLMSDSSLYLHTARFDNFPVSTLEAMRAGIPTIVSNRTGTKSLVKQVNKNFVVSLDENKIKEQVINYFEKTENEKQKLSKDYKKLLKNHNLENKKEEFKNIITKIAKE